MTLWLCKNCSKTQVLENRRENLYAPALGPFNCHITVKCKCVHQFLINLTLTIFIRQIFEVLKQRPISLQGYKKKLLFAFLFI